MFLRSNARAAGLVDRGEPLQATYVAALEAGAVVGVVAHCWNGMVLVQAPAEHELGVLARWRASFSVEALRAADGLDLRRASQADVLLQHARAADWVLVRGETPVAYALFNAMLPDIVQIGGVWTPPEFRGRGYARSVVAGSLVAAGKQGVRRAVLFADPSNAAARAAYLAIGFAIVGDYGLVLFAP